MPAAALGIIVGVAISNSSAFARGNSYLLARLFGMFTIYVVIHNCFMFHKKRGGADGLGISSVQDSALLKILCGLLTGIPAGLLGIGGGVVCVPAQQFFLKMPLKRAISNSAATIASIALIGAVYKNATLSEHSIEVAESLKIAIFVIPGAIVGAFIGGRCMHKLPANVVRVVFILLAAVATYKLLTVAPST